VTCFVPWSASFFICSIIDLGPADVRDDAVGAELVAASHDTDKGLIGYAFILDAEDGLKLFKGVGLVVSCLRADFLGYCEGLIFFGECSGDESGYPWYLCGSADKALGHTADDTDYKIGSGLLDVFEMTEVREHPLFGVVANGAGVYQDDIGLLDGVREAEACFFEGGSHEGGVQLVHLAPEALYMYSFLIHVDA
jgi:hypothetical protein